MSLKDILEFTLTPAEFADYTGLSPDMQRMRRARGQLDEFGEKVGNRWLYSPLDAMLVHCAMKIARYAVPFADAPSFAMMISPAVAEWATFDEEHHKVPSERLFYVFKGVLDLEDGPDVWHFAPFVYNGTNEVYPAGFLLDAKQLAERLPRVLRETLSAGGAKTREQFLKVLQRTTDDIADESEKMVADKHGVDD